MASKAWEKGLPLLLTVGGAFLLVDAIIPTMQFVPINPFFKVSAGVLLVMFGMGMLLRK